MQVKPFHSRTRAALVGGLVLLGAAGLVAAWPVSAQSATPVFRAQATTVVGRAQGGSPVRALLAGAHSMPEVTSSQWSGYADTNHTNKGTFRNIAASWNVPEIPGSACPPGSYGSRYAWVWAGLAGGLVHSPVELAGTQSKCHDGSLSYLALYETFPNNSEEAFPVSPGDHMSAYIDYTGSHYLLSVVDDSQDKSYSTLLGCPSGQFCENYVAEVVVGVPAGCTASAAQVCNGSLWPLADFDYVTFSGVSDATSNAGGGLGTHSFGPEKLTAKKGSTVLSKVTRPWAKDGFVDSWKASGAP